MKVDCTNLDEALRKEEALLSGSPEASQPTDEPASVPTTGPCWRRVPPPRDLCGLALSGGGIRSATFNLGLLQELNAKGLLGKFDYLSTVSGGGYIGGFWSAWRQRNPKAASVFPSAGAPEALEVRHLREFSNFLRPRLGLFSFETGRIVAGVAGALLPSLLTATSLMVLVLLLWLALLYQTSAVDDVAYAIFFLGGAMAVVHTLMELLWWRRKRAAEEKDTTAFWFYVLWALVSVLATTGAWWVLWHFALRPFPLMAGLSLPMT